ncbi:MAG TPA: CDGSH iron-sulfur domain-containing protein [Anaerolineaceae bacterium]|nr:CDGSH iron-sulfur domain-containing protein [Anaerolineaceae bacterium]
MDETPKNERSAFKIVIMHNGSYHVYGNVPLVHKTQVVSEYGEPLTWIKDRTYPIPTSEDQEFYGLCRCGHSGNKPFCDGTHRKVGFEGTEAADTRPTETRAVTFPDSTRIIVKKDVSLCMLSGFCGFSNVSLQQMLEATEDTMFRSLVMAMVERCPSGALTYRVEEDGPDVEPDLPVQIAVTTEMTSEGPIQGPLWVTGGIPIERSDGKPFETRNRVTLCNCGQSCQKPLCDGTHRLTQEQALKKKRGHTAHNQD